MKQLLNVTHRLVRGTIYFLVGAVVGCFVGAVEGFAVGILDVEDGEVYDG